MYEYSIEIMEIPAKLFKQKPKAKELNQLLDLINTKANDGWELVCNTFMAADGVTSATQTFVCTFKRSKEY